MQWGYCKIRILNITCGIFSCLVSKELCCLNYVEWGVGTLIELSEKSWVNSEEKANHSAFKIKVHLR